MTRVESEEEPSLDRVRSVGRITKIDESGVYTEDRIAKKREKRKLESGAAIFLKPCDISKASSAFFSTPRGVSETSDYVWLRNGDEFPCEFIKLDKRFAYLRAFDVDVKVPRGRVSVIRFRSR